MMKEKDPNYLFLSFFRCSWFASFFLRLSIYYSVKCDNSCELELSSQPTQDYIQ